MTIFAGFSQAFDTGNHTMIVKKMQINANMGLSKHFVHWILSFIDERRQFVQIIDKTSELVDAIWSTTGLDIGASAILFIRKRP